MLLRALRAHGGWENWRRIRRIELSLERLPGPGAETPPASPAEGPPPAPPEAALDPSPVERVSATFTLDARTLEPVPLGPPGEERTNPRSSSLPGALAPGPTPRQAAGTVPASLAAAGPAALPGPPFPPGAGLAGSILGLASPFAFINPRLEAEHLGREVDSQAGITLVKVKYSWTEDGEPRWCVASFDAASHRLRRLLSAVRPGAFCLVVLAGDFTPPRSGLVFAGERRVHKLARLYAHVDRERPDAVERLLEVRLERAGDEE